MARASAIAILNANYMEKRLEDADSTIKAASVWCLAAIADHEAALASECREPFSQREMRLQLR
mgnify:CR=1 FL=1